MAHRGPGEIPLYIALLCLPDKIEDWLDCSEDRLLLQRCCYYYRETGPVSDHVSTVTVYIPQSQMLTPAILRQILADAEAVAKGLA